MFLFLSSRYIGRVHNLTPCSSWSPEDIWRVIFFARTREADDDCLYGAEEMKREECGKQENTPTLSHVEGKMILTVLDAGLVVLTLWEKFLSSRDGDFEALHLNSLEREGL